MNSLEYAQKLIRDNPTLFNRFCDRELLETKIALALTDFSLICLSTKIRDEFIEATEPATDEEIREEIHDTWEGGTLPPIFNDIVNSHFPK